MKGSPEALKPLLTSVPANYDVAYANLAAEGARPAEGRRTVPAVVRGVESARLARAVGGADSGKALTMRNTT